jgi:uncharacterized Zn-binding protein involved in type VI secretion
MPAAARVGDLGTPFVTVPVIATGSPDVLINGRPCAREDDITASFKKKQGRKILVLISTILAPSSNANVFVNNKPVAQIGTKMTNGAKVITGSDNVFIGR